MSTFRKWLCQQGKRNDPVGDIARDVQIDFCAKGLSSVEDLTKHITEAHGICEAGKAAIEKAAREYEDYKRRCL